MAVSAGAVTASEPARRGRLGRFWQATIGKKIVMAVSGVLMAGFLVTHMSANLLAFAGPDHINGYSRFLHSVPELLWPVRIGLLVSLIVHVVSAWQLTRTSQAARPTKYDKRVPQVSTFAARTIRWGGVIILVFVVYHLLHFTFGTLHPGFAESDPYANLVVGYRSQPAIAAVYLVVMIIVGLHLYHGLWSSSRTLGIRRPSPWPFKRRVALAVAAALWLGFSLVPIGVLTGVIGPRPGQGSSLASER
jgi:succinate dehydrogenase / fumarate reductase, cytochrome b subunit